jgi:hypothetical protein
MELTCEAPAMTTRTGLSAATHRGGLRLVLASLLAAAGSVAAQAMPINVPGKNALQATPLVQQVADLGELPPPHRNVMVVPPFKDDAAWDTIFRLADGAINTAIIDPRRKDFYRQDYFYGGTPYTGRQFYGAPVYYGGPYYSYYIHER